MKIKIPNNFAPERLYILDVIVRDFLGLNFIIEKQANLADYIFILENNTKLIIKDSFFNRFISENYLDKKNIPKNVFFTENQFLPEKNIPILFGNDLISVTENEIICGNDIFAASFFMLSRWEEYVVSEKDEFGRFPEKQALSIKCKFNHRPIVNEYAEMLWNMLLFLGCTQKRKIHKYKLKITHDIDFFRKYISLKITTKAIIGDILHRRSFKLALNTLLTSIKIKLNIEKDPFNTFEYFMEISEKYNLKSHFYFIPAKAEEKETTYNLFNKIIIKTIKEILKRGHIIGIHTGWSTFNNIEILEHEIANLKQISIKVEEGRQHYLRFEVPKTWQNWEAAGLREDSSIGFSKTIGFRAGTCFSYSVFDILERKRLKLIETPLIVMDAALKKSSLGIVEMLKELSIIGEIVRKYNGIFVLLWHNSNINSYEWKNFNLNYAKIIDLLKQE